MSDIGDNEDRLTERTGSSAPGTGRKVNLRELIQQRLHESGWYDKVRHMVRCMLKKRGVKQVTYKVVHEVMIPKAHSMVPDELGDELQIIVREALDSSRF